MQFDFSSQFELVPLQRKIFCNKSLHLKLDFFIHLNVKEEQHDSVQLQSVPEAAEVFTKCSGTRAINLLTLPL